MYYIGNVFLFEKIKEFIIKFKFIQLDFIFKVKQKKE